MKSAEDDSTKVVNFTGMLKAAGKGNKQKQKRFVSLSFVWEASYGPWYPFVASHEQAARKGKAETEKVCVSKHVG